MRLVVHGRSDDLAGIGDGGQQLHLIERQRLRALGRFQNMRLQHLEMFDKLIGARQGIAIGGQGVERGGDVKHRIALHEAEAVVIEAADFHSRLSR